MKNKGMYRLLSGVLCTSVLLSSQVYAAAPADYSDFPQNWSKDAMEFAVKNNFITGVSEDKIAPKAALTRAQLAAILSRVMKTGAGDVSVLDNFNDADKNAWYAGSMAKAVELNILYGDGDSIYPDRPVTRQELFTILVRAFSVAGGDESALAPYSDAGSVSSWARAAISAMIAQGYAAGYEDKTIRPTQQVTREEFAQLLYRMQEFYGSSDSSDDKTETKTDEPTKTDGKKTSGGGGGGSSSGGGSHSGGSTVTANAIVDETQAKVQSLAMGTWLPLVFKDGFNTENVTVTVDGTNVTSAMSKVTTDGTIAKLPLTGTPKQVVIKSGDKTQTITLSGNGTASVYTSAGKYLPDYILAHGAVAAWDYHLTNYDKDGNPRVQPAKTTFDTQEAVNTHPYYSPDTVITEDEAAGNIYKVSGTVEIMFNYNTDAEKAWFDGIGDTVALVENNGRYNQIGTLDMTKEANAAHGSGKVGVLRIPVGQANFFSNGRYYVRVQSTGGDKATTLVPIHLVNDVAPEFQTTESATSGVNLHFNVKNMTYGITNPIERVTLTDPTGATKTLRNIDDYYLFGTMFVLYNDVEAENGVNNIPYNGKYTMTVYSNGFKTVSKSFYVNGGESAPTKQAVATYKSAAYDVVTHATTSGGSGDSSSDGGSYMVSANLMFKSDLLVNALVLDQVGKATAASDKVVEDWYNMSGYDSLLNEGDVKTYYKWTGYLNAINDAKVAKDDGAAWLPFSEYITGDVETDLNRPYAVKEVLEDGLLGDVQHSDTYGRKDAPKVTVSDNEEGKNVVLTVGTEDKDYLNKVTAIYLNGDWLNALVKDTDYTIDAENGTITIKKELKLGENTITIDTEGYKSQVVEFEYNKVLENVTGLTAASERMEDETEELYTVTVTVEGSQGDFLKYLESVVLTDENNVDHTIFDARTGGVSSTYYEVQEGNKVVKLHKVTPGKYTLKVTAKYYGEAKTTEFEIERQTALKTAPGVDKQQKLADNKYRLTFTGMDNIALDKYLNAIKTVKTADGTAIDYSAEILRPAYGSRKDCLDLTGVAAGTKIVVTAEGYNSLEYTLLADSEVTKDAAPEVYTMVHQDKSSSEEVGHYRVTFKGMDTAELDTYLGKITSVTVKKADDTEATEYQKYTNSYNNAFGQNMYKLGGSSYSYNEYLDLADNGFAASGVTTVTIKADGYNDLTIEYDAANPMKASVPNVAAVWKDTDMWGTTEFYRFTFKDDESVAKYLKDLSNAGSAATVKVDNTTYSKGYSIGKENYVVNTSSNYLDLEASAFPKTGKVTITIQVEGYEDFSFECDMDNLPTVKAPKNVKVEKTETEDVYRINFEDTAMTADELKAYLTAVSSVEVENEEYEKASSSYYFDAGSYWVRNSESNYSYDYDCIDIYDNDDFKTDDTTTITIKVKGYEDLVCKYTPEGSDNGGGDNGNNGGETTTKTAAPTVGKVTYKSSDKYYEVSFEDGETSAVADYLEKITDVTVGGTSYKEVGYNPYGGNEYRCKGSILTLYTLNLGDGAFATDGTATKIVVKAEGYEDLEFTYPLNADNNGGTGDKDDNNTFDNDTVKVSECVKNQYDRYYLKFDGLDIKDFSITEVTVGEKQYEELYLLWGNSKYNKAESEGKGIDCLELSADGFNTSGDTKIVIKGTLNGKEITIEYTFTAE